MKFKIVEGPEGIQGSPEWLNFRKGKIGASDAATIMGISPWETPLQLWERMTFDKEKTKTTAMKRGTDLEAKAKDWVNEKLKVNFQPAVIQSLENPERIASLDGFEIKGSMPFLLEIKVPGMKSHLEAINGVIPDHYYPQLQHQMDVAGVDEMLYCSFDGEKGIIIICYRDAKYCEELFSREMLFMKHLNDFRPPEPVDRDWIEIDDSEATSEVVRYRELSLIIDELEEEMKNIKASLIAKLDHSRCKIGPAKIQKIMRKGAIEYDRIEELKRVNLEFYRKPPIETWKISFYIRQTL